jgi:hypothetical protein
LIIKDILKDAKKLRALTSLLPEEFEALLVKFESKFEAYIEKYKLDGSIRYNKYSPRSEKGLASSAEKLFFILVYQKQNPTQEFLAFSFNLNQDMCAKWIKVLLPILEKSLHQYRAEQTPTKVNEILQESQTYLVDVTERPVQRDTYEREEFYTEKKTTYDKKSCYYR